MLELHIFNYLLEKESASRVVSGRVVGWSLSHFRDTYNIPKATFYRALNLLIEQGFIIKQKRNYYVISKKVRVVCNGIADAELIR